MTLPGKGYERVYRFAGLSGLRLSVCLLRKSDVLRSAGRIGVRSKGGKLNRVPLTLRFHDLRHPAATRLLRGSGNLEMVQRLLNHACISTTAK